MQYTSEFKAKVILELLHDQVSVSKIARQYCVNSKTIYRWKKKFLESASLIFHTGTTSSIHKKEFKALQQKKIMLQKQLELAKRQKQDALQGYHYFVAVNNLTKNILFRFHESHSPNRYAL